MKLRILCLMLLFGFVFLDAGIEAHFKKIPKNAKSVGIKNVDFIYVINLDQRPEKLENCISELQPYNIKPYRFSAVNGWELSYEALSDLGITYQEGMKPGIMGTYYPVENQGSPQHERISIYGKSYFSHCMSRGAVGIVLSHLSILEHAYDSGFKTIWVMEDDIKVIRNPHVLSKYIADLDKIVGKQGWDILFTDRDTKNQKGVYVPCTGYARRPNYTPVNSMRFKKRTEISSELRQVGARYGAYSMIVRRSGMKKILDFLKQYKIFLPYDMEFYLPGNIKMFSVTKDVVSTDPQALSDNGGPNYKEK